MHALQVASALTGVPGGGMANAALNPAMAAVLAASMAQSVGVGGALTKMARELYIGNLPGGGVSIQQLTDLLPERGHEAAGSVQLSAGHGGRVLDQY